MNLPKRMEYCHNCNFTSGKIVSESKSSSGKSIFTVQCVKCGQYWEKSVEYHNHSTLTRNQIKERTNSNRKIINELYKSQGFEEPYKEPEYEYKNGRLKLKNK